MTTAKTKRSPPERSSKSTKPSHNLKPSGDGLRKAQTDVRVRFTGYLPRMLELQAELIPFSTACDMIGVKTEDYAHWVSRFPAIQAELKRARAGAMIDLQRRVAKGEQGWQALCRIGEMADPANWLKSAPGRPTNTASPYSSAMSKRKPKR